MCVQDTQFEQSVNIGINKLQVTNEPVRALHYIDLPNISLYVLSAEVMYVCSMS